MTGPDGQLWLRVAVSHRRYASERSFRRALLRDLRRVLHRVPGTYLDLMLECAADGTCCRREPIELTSQKLGEALEDWVGGEVIASIGEKGYRAMREAGIPIRLPGGVVVP